MTSILGATSGSFEKLKALSQAARERAPYRVKGSQANSRERAEPANRSAELADSEAAWP